MTEVANHEGYCAFPAQLISPSRHILRLLMCVSMTDYVVCNESIAEEHRAEAQLNYAPEPRPHRKHHK